MSPSNFLPTVVEGAKIYRGKWWKLDIQLLLHVTQCCIVLSWFYKWPLSYKVLVYECELNYMNVVVCVAFVLHQGSC